MSQTDNTKITNRTPLLEKMEPGVLYTMNLGSNPNDKYRARISQLADRCDSLRRRNAQLVDQLKAAKVIIILMWTLFIGVTAFSCCMFNKFTRDFNDLSDAYEQILDEQRDFYTTNKDTNEDLIDYDKNQSEIIVIPTTPSVPSSSVDTEVYNDTNVNADEVTTNTEAVKEYTFPEMFDFIPLDDDLKQYIYTSAIKANIPAEVVFSLAWKETTYRPHLKSSTNDHGLFQINEINFEYLAKKLGYTYEEFCEKIYDPYVNTDCMIIILTECRDYYNNDNWHHVLMRYNMGPGRTNQLFKEGVYSSKYSRALLAYAEETFGFTDIELK